MNEITQLVGDIVDITGYIRIGFALSISLLITIIVFAFVILVEIPRSYPTKIVLDLNAIRYIIGHLLLLK